MPLISIETNESVDSVVRPAILSVVRNVMTRTRIDMETQVQLDTGTGGSTSFGTINGKDKSDVKFEGARILTVNVQEEYDEQMLDRRDHINDYNPIFLDKELDIRLSPFYTKQKFSLNFRLQFQSEGTAKRWVKGIRRMASKDGMMHKHTVRYKFAIPRGVIWTLAEMSKLRKVAVDQKMGAWLKDCFVDRVTVMGDSLGKQRTFMVDEEQTSVNGWFTFDGVPELEQEDQKWFAAFQYNVELMVPYSFNLQYPLVVFNQLIPKGLRKFEHNMSLNSPAAHKEVMKHCTDKLFPDGRRVAGERVTGFSIPSWDEWIPSRVRPNHFTLIKMMVLRDAENPRALLDLDQLGSIKLDPVIRDFLVGEAPYLHEAKASPFHVALYNKDQPLVQDMLAVDEHLVVSANADLNLRSSYHVWFGLIKDLSRLNQDAVNRLLKNPEALMLILSAIDPSYPLDNIPVLDNGEVPLAVWNRLRAEIKYSNRNFSNNFERSIHSVGQFIITASGKTLLEV